MGTNKIYALSSCGIELQLHKRRAPKRKYVAYLTEEGDEKINPITLAFFDTEEKGRMYIDAYKHGYGQAYGYYKYKKDA